MTMARLRSRSGPLPPEIPYSEFALKGWRRFADDTAIVDVLNDRTVTFGQLEQRVLRTAGRLQRCGVGNQTHVQFVANNSVSAIVAFQAAVFCNATLSLFSPDETLKYDEYRAQTEDAEVKFIITDLANYEFVVHRYLADHSETLVKVLLVDGAPTRHQHPKASFIDDEARLPDSGGGAFTPPTVNVRSDALLMLYTSGSTGRPKGVLHSHYSYISSMQNMRLLDFYHEGDRFLLTSSLTYVSGVIFHSGVLSHGATLLLGSSQVESDCLRYCELYKPTVSILLEIPARNIVSSAAGNPNARKILDTFRLLVVSGTVFPEALRTSIGNLFSNAKFMQLYGMTEMLGPLVVSDPAPSIGTVVGYSVPNTTVRVINEHGSPVAVGESGEVEFNGIQKTLGYWKRSIDSDVTADGFFRTGDIGVIDSDGQLTLLGRNKHFITCLDARVAPLEIEEILLKHPAVAEAVVVGIPHPDYQQAPTALVVLRDKSASTASLSAELIEFVASQSAEYKHLHGGVFFTDALEKTTSGKYARGAITKTIQGLVDECKACRL